MDQLIPIQPVPTPIVPQPAPQPTGFNPVGYPVGYKWPLIALFSFLLGIASVLAYQKYQPTSQPTRSNLVGPSPLVSPKLGAKADDLTAAWKIYKDTNNQFYFKYPSNWFVENANDQEGGYINFFQEGTNPEITTTQETLGNEVFRIMIYGDETIFNNLKSIIPKPLETTVDGKPAQRSLVQIDILIGSTNKKILHLEIRESSKPYIDLILSTFKFLDAGAGACQPTFPVETNTQEMTASQNYALECTLKKTAGDCLLVDIYNQSAKDFSQPDGEPDCRWAILP